MSDSTVTASLLKSTEERLQLIARLNPRVNALLTVTDGQARSAARELDAARDWGGLLHGLFVSVKDNIEVAGVRTTWGSKTYIDYVSKEDAEVVTRLRKSGAILVGKDNMAEFAYGGTSQNEISAGVRNPWDVTRIPGGSSGGSGAAVAAGLCDASLGSDTAGSVRVPASMCGVVGLRPTVGRVSNRGTFEDSVGFDTIGPLARTVTTVARVFAAIAGQDPQDPGSVDRPVENFLPTLGDGVRGLRIGVPRRFFFEDLEKDVEARVLEALRVFEAAGAKLVDVIVPRAEESHPRTSLCLLAADMADLHRERMKNQPDLIGAEVLRRLQAGVPISAADYAQSMRWLRDWRLDVSRLFANVDFLLTPTTPLVATKIAASADMISATRQLSRFTVGLGAAGFPAMSVPCGFDGDGLPVGMQLVGPHFGEPVLLRAGVEYQKRTGFHRQLPKLE
jgi:aspartyl-tRNA(Asn)/glutamyl-tRNA(Gln) amidotransferase subunit A